jgi:DNA polymerase-3 subunit gamma/tau
MTETYLALYRKYRPETFEDVVGQTQAVELLTKTFTQQKVSHAYLFCGGRGTGKTTVARIVAREIGCNPEDIIEIDAASNRGIDEIRELRDAVRTAPFSSPYKVYIVDEAHMLTKEAANALLKTLEEPPSHVVFILATTDPEKLPQTIVSRCQKVVFKEPDVETLSKRLSHVATSEGYTLPVESAELIARHGNASYRDALGYLEQVLGVSDTVVEHTKVTELLGVGSQEELLALLRFFCEKNAQGVVETVRTMEGKNTQALRVYDGVLEMLRMALCIRIGVDVSSVHKEPLTQLAAEFPRVIASSTILYLLSKRELVKVSQAHAWTAVEAILFGGTE